MSKKQIKEIIREISGEFLAENKLELYNVEFKKEVKDWFLRVFIDKAGDQEEYISTDDCEKVSRFLSEKLDEIDPIKSNYYLEVSSPGIDRELSEPEHYEKYKGKLVEVKLYKAINGEKVYEGILEGLKDESIIIKDEEGNEKVFPLSQVAKTNLAVVF